MDISISLAVIISYFFILFITSWLTGRKSDDQSFFTANRNAPWYLVAFGMIGTSLSGVTFISVPGAVGSGQFAYLQFVLGNWVGYQVIALILLPLYYRLNLTSIYGFLGQRFGESAYKTGSILFILSRIVGASLRLYLVALVLQLAVCDAIGIPFWGTVLISIILIYIYTFRGGIKTVIWTDTLQTATMLLGAGLAVYFMGKQLGWGAGEMISQIQASDFSQVFFWDWRPGNFFGKQFLAGMFISIVMTGLDQDMMQKNLTVKTLKDAQKNVFWFSTTFVFANILFLGLGALLYLFGQQQGIVEMVFADDCALKILDPASGEMICSKTDQLFPLISINYLGPVAGALFVLGVIAAAYSSADSALTALTTSFCVDILGFEKKKLNHNTTRTRQLVHLAFAFVLFGVILVFNSLNNAAVVTEIFRAAGYTYGPLLGLFVFGMYTKWQLKDKWIPLVCIVSPLLSYIIQLNSPRIGYEFGFEILLLNGLLTFLGLILLRKGKTGH